MRLCQLIVTICTDVLRCILDKYIPPSHLKSILNTQKGLLTGQGCHLSKQQKAILFPRGPIPIVVSSKDFDISLLYTLLRNIAGIPPHGNGWGNNPTTGDTSLSACIEIIRSSRNNLNGHNLTGKICDSDFNDVWSTLKFVVTEIEANELSGTSFVQDINMLHRADMGPVTSQQYIEEIKRMELEEYEIKKVIYSVKGIICHSTDKEIERKLMQHTQSIAFTNMLSHAFEMLYGKSITKQKYKHRVVMQLP